MTANAFIEDDDLFLYAMQALSNDEAAAIATSLSESEDLRRRLTDIQISIGLYAESTVALLDTPKRSLERFRHSLAAVESPASSPLPSSKVVSIHPARPQVVPWIGWAAAAVLLFTVGLLAFRSHRLQQQVSQQGSQLRQTELLAAALSDERDALRNAAVEEQGRANASVAELSKQSAELSEQAAAASNHAAEEGETAERLRARLNTEARKATKESTRAADSASAAAATAQQRDQLQDALSTQQSQLNQLASQAAAARQVLDALSDPTALRVSLTVPKQKKAPSGRGTYVPSRGTLLFAGSNLPQLRGSRVYQLWLMPTDGSNPIPAGTFLPDASGNASVVSTTFQKSISAKGFAVTAEPAGGSQTPTLPILLAAS